MLVQWLLFLSCRLVLLFAAGCCHSYCCAHGFGSLRAESCEHHGCCCGQAAQPAIAKRFRCNWLLLQLIVAITAAQKHYIILHQIVLLLQCEAIFVGKRDVKPRAMCRSLGTRATC